MTDDLSAAAGAPVAVNIATPEHYSPPRAPSLGICLDDLDIAVDTYTPNASFLSAEGAVVEERLFSHLLKSNCPKTGQPDWGSIVIDYKGPSLDREGLLRYIISFRNHNDFHEQCVEKIFQDIAARCTPERLMVYARYTRRGGLDINPLRSNYPIEPENIPFFRQ